MKRLFSILLMAAAVSFVSCEKDSEETTDTGNNNGNGNGGGETVQVDNNTVVAGSEKGSVVIYNAFTANDFNTGNDYIDVFIYDDILVRDYTWQIGLHEVPSRSTTLQWQSGSNAPGDLKSNEFYCNVKVNGESWYNPFTSEGYQETGEMVVTINGDKITFTLNEIELSDNYIVPNVTATKKCLAQATMNYTEFKAAAEGNDSGAGGDLIAE